MVSESHAFDFVSSVGIAQITTSRNTTLRIKNALKIYHRLMEDHLICVIVRLAFALGELLMVGVIVSKDQR